MFDCWMTENNFDKRKISVRQLHCTRNLTEQKVTSLRYATLSRRGSATRQTTSGLSLISNETSDRKGKLSEVKTFTRFILSLITSWSPNNFWKCFLFVFDLNGMVIDSEWLSNLGHSISIYFLIFREYFFGKIYFLYFLFSKT